MGASSCQLFAEILALTSCCRSYKEVRLCSRVSVDVILLTTLFHTLI